ncbi:uncharacterized protein LOC113859442 [Abrus precatorius]|uniref:Uncharacterized protein LOC113859442 n=1 Tax=Abrus precatorius TaxID=3816 RepID=A0A8B8KVU5_ABRPR|nr:uncharacterized protein LOC113859442 [Abrus precatorius]
MTLTVYVGCPIVVKGWEYRGIPMSGLDVILGIGWLTTNHVVIDCAQRRLIFPEQQGLQEMIPTCQVEAALDEGASCFILLAVMDVKQEQELQSVPVVRDFSEIIPDDVLGVPPTKKIEFGIDLVPRAEPVLVAPNRMVSKELMELKNQIEDLMPKKMIIPSVSP